MIEDFCKEWIDGKTRGDVNLSDIKGWMDKDEFLTYVRDWKNKVWREIIKNSGKEPKHSMNDVLKNPEMFGYNYNSQKKGKRVRDDL